MKKSRQVNCQKIIIYNMDLMRLRGYIKKGKKELKGGVQDIGKKKKEKGANKQNLRIKNIGVFRGE